MKNQPSEEKEGKDEAMLYCERCKWLSRPSWSYENRCVHPSNQIRKNNAIGPEWIIKLTPEYKNMDNACDCYEPKDDGKKK
jgi:hypothetical protein